MTNSWKRKISLASLMHLIINVEVLIYFFIFDMMNFSCISSLQHASAEQNVVLSLHFLFLFFDFFFLSCELKPLQEAH